MTDPSKHQFESDIQMTINQENIESVENLANNQKRVSAFGAEHITPNS